MYQKIKNIWKIKKWRWALILAAILILGAIFLLFSRNENPFKSYTLGTVERGGISEEVSITGKVTAVKEASLSLSSSGRITFVGAKVGSKVTAGTLLVSMNNAHIQAELKQAEINLETETVEYNKLVRASHISGVKSVQNASSNETALINAREALFQALKEGYAKIDNALSTYIDQFFENPRSAPQFGTYAIGAITSEKIELNGRKRDLDRSLNKWKDEINSDIFNLESGENIALEAIQKIDALAQDISSIVNSYSPVTTTEENLYSGYKSNISAARIIFRTVSADITSTSRLLSSQESLISPDELKLKELAKKSAEAEVQSVRSRLEETLIRAPFSGIVTSIDAIVGEIASPATPLVHLISPDQFEIEAYVAESDISKVKIGDEAKITLDAYGQEQVFEAKVFLIDVAETVLEGVATYKVTFIFGKDDERIKSGMTANIDVRTAERIDVIRIPQRALIFRDSERYVKVIRDEKLVEETQVTTGLRDGDGYIEIISGLNEGDTIVVFDKNTK